mgnify:CR=1 FL=1
MYSINNIIYNNTFYYECKCYTATRLKNIIIYNKYKYWILNRKRVVRSSSEGVSLQSRSLLIKNRRTDSGISYLKIRTSLHFPWS